MMNTPAGRALRVGLAKIIVVAVVIALAFSVLHVVAVALVRAEFFVNDYEYDEQPETGDAR